MKHKFTPGPWKLTIDHPKRMDDGTPFSATWLWDAPMKHIVMLRHIENPRQYADLRLMAAAPDLLAACEAVEDYILKNGVGNYPGDMAMIAIIQKAIAKALPEITYPDHPETLVRRMTRA